MSVGTIIKNAPRLKEVGESVIPTGATRLCRSRDVMENMERLLSVWIGDSTQRHMPFSLSVIQENDRSLWNNLRQRRPGPTSEVAVTVAETFTVSHGWFNRFKKRANLHNIHVMVEAASVDEVAARSFPETLNEIIKCGGYSAKQVFNIDETGLYWKRMPFRIYIDQEEKTAPGFKATKDHLTLIMGSDAERDVKLKPLFVYLSESPCALKGVLKNQLPVIWRSNAKM
ncbi:tigger transposable element-derived protein 1-like [Homarus americanus]|uniref:tigger transposable element-derived protein 1-like n=1 Tax=Homarus americanus TaxID=6706 RepID=UPI001C46E82A|nr:tigger transposable element-derived protein 1-like [Homarus americanus]